MSETFSSPVHRAVGRIVPSLFTPPRRLIRYMARGQGELADSPSVSLSLQRLRCHYMCKIVLDSNETITFEQDVLVFNTER